MTRAVRGLPENRGHTSVVLPLVGAQISSAGGVTEVPTRALAIGAEVVQIFSSNPRTWRVGRLEPVTLRSLAATLRRYRLPLFLHTIYLVNLASPDEELRNRSQRALVHALVSGGLSEAAGVVTHVGSHRGLGFERAAPFVSRMVAAARMEAGKWLAGACVSSSPVVPPVLLENGAGAGATVGSTLEELAALVSASPEGTMLCLDTAHLFAAGYPVHRGEGLESLVADLRRLSLLPRVGLIHLNDSTAPFASHRDRHANPGVGQIGLRGLARVVRHPALSSVPFVLEVPGPEKRGPSAAELEVIKAMRRTRTDGATVPGGPAALGRATPAGRRAATAPPVPTEQAKAEEQTDPDPPERPARGGRYPEARE